MTENGNGQHPPEPAERGRYAIYRTQDGGILIARTAGLCDTCQACGCGQPQEHIGPVPGPVLQFMENVRDSGGKLPGPAEMLKLVGIMRSGPKDEAVKAARRVTRRG